MDGLSQDKNSWSATSPTGITNKRSTQRTQRPSRPHPRNPKEANSALKSRNKAHICLIVGTAPKRPLLSSNRTHTTTLSTLTRLPNRATAAVASLACACLPAAAYEAHGFAEVRPHPPLLGVASAFFLAPEAGTDEAFHASFRWARTGVA